jgi:Protein of unknown function (DUF1631)
VSDAKPAVDRRALLTQCRTAVEKRLSQQLEALLDGLPPKLEELHRGAKEREERDQYANALSRLHNGRAAFFDRFRKEFGERFDAAVQSLQGAFDPFGGEPSRDELAAMRTNVLESEVAIGKLAALVKQHAPEELAKLSARFATLFRRSMVDDGDNPLGPLTVARSVYAGVGTLELQGRAMRVARDELEQHFVAPVADLYKGVNGAFAAHGVAPAKSATAVTRPAPPPPAPVPAPVQAPPPPPAAVAAAERALNSALDGTSLPIVLDLFLRQTWGGLLARAHAAGGYDGAAWSEAAKTMQELVWSLKPVTAPAERARLVALLPGLLKRVSVGMEAAGMDPEGREAVLEELMARHREILQPPTR